MKTINMKKAGMVLAAMLICATAIADTETINGIEWTYDINNGKAKITTVAKTAKGVLEVPSTLGGCPIVGISFCAFRGCKGITGVTIPDSVISIGSDAFAFCWKLTSVKIGNSVKIVEKGAFTDCTALESVTFGKSVERVGDKAFDRCHSLQVVEFTGNAPKIGQNVFDDASGCHVYLPEGNTTYAIADGKWQGMSAHWCKPEIANPEPKTIVPQRKARVGTGQYMVIDLSEGLKADKFHVSYLNSVPKGGWTDEYKTTKLVLRRVKSGSFTMGSPSNELGRSNDGEYWNEIQHKVTISKPFYIGVFEVTQKQYELVTGKITRSDCGDMRPVFNLSWNEIRGDSSTYGWPSSRDVGPGSFMGILRAKTGIETFDLPTEAMWEYACRAGTTTPLNNGKKLADEYEDKNVAEVARYNCNNGSGERQAGGRKLDVVPDGKGGFDDYHTTVGFYKPNTWGLYDMHGNVSEWCLDWMGALASGAVTDPAGPVHCTMRTSQGVSQAIRIVRGGSNYKFAKDVRSAARSGRNPAYRDRSFGFRLCCFTAPPATVSENKSQKNAESGTKQGAGKGKPKGR